MIVERITYMMVVLILICGWVVGPSQSLASEEMEKEDMAFLLPEEKGWELVQTPDVYLPESLFEYINGAAEAYLSYGFKELIVAEFAGKESDASVLVEIYNMDSTVNTFGIYGAERYVDNRFIPVGIQGYIEDESLNFMVGSYYIKLLCFECTEDSENVLISFAKKIVSRVKDPGLLPSLLDSFPENGRIKNSEKFILRNVLGYGFLEKGYFVNYKRENIEFDCFVLDAGSANAAEMMLKQYLERKKGLEVKKTDEGFHIQDRYYANIYIAKTNTFVCGVMKIPDGSEEVGEIYLEELMKNLKEKT